jgi:hypothetical protein
MKINIEIEITEDQIITSLEDWWANNLTNPRIWETKIGKFVKDKLSERGNFKGKPRGTPNIHISKENRNNLEIKAIHTPDKMTEYEWKTLHRNYLLNRYNNIAEFKQNNILGIDGKWRTKENFHVSDYSKPGFTDIRIPPVEPIKDLTKFIKSYTEELF